MNQAPLYLLIFFPLLWFGVVMLLSLLSGWFGLMERFPDRTEERRSSLVSEPWFNTYVERSLRIRQIGLDCGAPSMRKADKRREFDGRLVARGPGGAWTFLPIPFDVQKEFGKKSRVPVSGTINGFAFRNSLMPEGDGTHSMMVGKELQAGAKAKPGDKVRVSLQVDDTERTVEVPDELKRALKGDAGAKSAFEALPYSSKKEFADWIGTAKKAETKAARVEKALDLLKSGVKRLR